MRRKIGIKNETHWQTGQLRAFVVHVANQVLDEDQIRGFHVTFKYRHTIWYGCSGHAQVKGTLMQVNIPFRAEHMDKTDLALVIAHEIGHLTGLRHPAMRGAGKWNRVGNWREIYGWAESLPLEIKPEKKKTILTGVAYVENKIGHIQKKIDEWERKKERAAKAVKAWSRKLKYQQNRQTVLASKPPKE